MLLNLSEYSFKIEVVVGRNTENNPIKEIRNIDNDNDIVDILYMILSHPGTH